MQHLPESEAHALVFALRIDQLEELALARLNMTSYEELQGIVSQLRVEPSKPVIDRCLKMYAAAENFNQANRMATSLIEPLLEYMDHDQLQTLISAGRNIEVRESFEFRSLLFTMKKTGCMDVAEMAEAAATNGFKEKIADILED